MEGATRDPAALVGAAQCANATDDLARGATREGQEQDPFRRDATFEEDLDSGGERRRLAGARSRDDAERSVAERGRLSLSLVEFSLRGEHAFEL